MELVQIVEANLNDHESSLAILRLLNMYAMDRMGGGQQLSKYVNQNLIEGLKKHPTTKVFLAFSEKKPVGIAVCFLGFSTFAAKPLLNIHDLAVEPEFRGKGIGRALLKAVEETAITLGCCKLTLEVLENNFQAKETYQGFGFSQGQYAAENGGMLFFIKPLNLVESAISA